jgi:hypothetical protein
MSTALTIPTPDDLRADIRARTSELRALRRLLRLAEAAEAAKAAGATRELRRLGVHVTVERPRACHAEGASNA